MTRDALLLGVDVGGTTTAAGAVTREGAVLVEQRVLTHRDGKGRAPETIIELLGSVREQAERRGHAVEAIGVGVPGPVDPTVGRIGEHVPHVPELAGRALAAELAERFGRPAFVDNDVNALALGEWMFGAGRGTRSLVVLAPGTGSERDRKSTRLNSSHLVISYAVFCLKKKKRDLHSNSRAC